MIEENLLEGIEKIPKRRGATPQQSQKQIAGQKKHFAVGMRATFYRLTIEMASQEFQIDNKSLRNKLRALGVEPGPDNRYTIYQCACAKFGSKDMEQTRNMREQADKHALANEETRKNLMPTRLFLNMLSTIGVTLCDYIKGSELDQQTKTDCLAHINAQMLDEEVIMKELML